MKNTENKVNLILETINKNEMDRKITLVLSESKAEVCSPSQSEEIRLMFNKNPDVREIFKNSINLILKDVFPKNYYGWGKYGKGEYSGIYDLEKNGRSKINYLNTNYSCFCILLRDVNKVLLSKKQKPISFNNIDNIEQLKETERFVNIINEYKYRIFDPNSSTFQSIMLSLTNSTNWGEQREKNTVEILKKYFGEDNVNAIGGIGVGVDMNDGIDCEVIIKGKIITAQIKPFGYIKNKNGFITVFDSANVKPYTTNWLIFAKNNKEILVFNNKHTKIEDGNFVFPEDDLIYTLR